MTFSIKGYLRENPGGGGVSGKTVSIIDPLTGVAPVTTAFTNLSGATDTTDASGTWEFTMDLSTGPVQIEADLGGGNTRYRFSDEQFMYGGTPISTLPKLFGGMSSGVVKDAGTEFAIAASATRVLDISPGYAVIKGYLFGWDSGDKTITGTANGSVGTTRYDLLCLRQYYNGTSAGKQDIVLLVGSNLADPPVTTTESDLSKFIQGANIWDFPIARCSLATSASIYSVTPIINNGQLGYPGYFGWFEPAIVGASTFNGNVTMENDLSVIGGVTVTGNTTLGNADTDETTIRGHVILTGTSPSVAATETAVVGASGSSVTSGSDGSFQTSSTVKASPSAGAILAVTFADSRPTSTYTVMVTPRSSDAADYDVYVTSQSGAGFTLSCTNTPTAGDTLNFAFQVM